MIKGIIFDFGDVICFWGDGLLGERRSLALGLPKETIKHIIWDYLDAAHEGKYHSLDDYFARAKPNLSVSENDIAQVFAEMEATAYIDQRMVDLISSLKSQYKIALLSNFSHGLENYLADRFHIDHLFDVVASSYNLKAKKPSPDIYKFTLDKLGLAGEECMFIDNTPGHVQAAELHGMRGIIFESFEHCKSELEHILKRQL